MGNDICDAVSVETEHRRFNMFQTVNHHNSGDNGLSSFPNTPKNELIRSQISTQSQNVKLEFKGHVIECKEGSIKYQISEKGVKQPIAINGLAKVYNQKDKQLVFQGQLKNSKFNGFGKLYKEDKLVYQGQFKNNRFDGWGITQEYIGEFRQGVYDGYGIYQEFQNQDQTIITFYYEGYFQSGLYSGSGVLMKGINLPASLFDKIHQDEGIFQFINDQIQHEMNLIQLNGNKQIYIGQFSNGFRHGFGRLFTEKMQFSGQFSHNMYHGLGTIYNRTNEGKRVTQAVFKMGKQCKD